MTGLPDEAGGRRFLALDQLQKGRIATEQAANGAGRGAPSAPTLIPRGGLGTGNVAAPAAPGHRHLGKPPDDGA